LAMPWSDVGALPNPSSSHVEPSTLPSMPSTSVPNPQNPFLYPIHPHLNGHGGQMQ
jgi:hypothetical protein